MVISESKLKVGKLREKETRLLFCRTGGWAGLALKGEVWVFDCDFAGGTQANPAGCKPRRARNQCADQGVVLVVW